MDWGSKIKEIGECEGAVKVAAIIGSAIFSIILYLGKIMKNSGLSSPASVLISSFVVISSISVIISIHNWKKLNEKINGDRN